MAMAEIRKRSCNCCGKTADYMDLNTRDLKPVALSLAMKTSLNEHDNGRDWKEIMKLLW